MNPTAEALAEVDGLLDYPLCRVTVACRNSIAIALTASRREGEVAGLERAASLLRGQVCTGCRSPQTTTHPVCGALACCVGLIECAIAKLPTPV